MTKKKVALALQGGGSWGAFSWGVLDRILAEPDIEITDICGTSAGAVSGSIVAYAMNSADCYEDGAAQARLDLAEFWLKICDSNHDLMRYLAVLQGNCPIAAFRDPVSDPNLPALTWLQNTKTLMEANPWVRYSGMSAIFNQAMENTATRKLRKLIRDFIPSYDVIREGKRLKLHVNAAQLTHDGFTNQVFSDDDVSLQSVMASATLRGMFKPVAIGDKYFFDGAYTQNPPIDALLEQTRQNREFDDVIWVMANPPKGQIIPRHQDSLSAKDLENYADLVLHHAYDHMAYSVLNEDKNDPKSHVIWFDAPKHYDQTSKQNTEKAFLLHLYQQGVQAAEEFIAQHKQDLGKTTTIDLEALQANAHSREKSIIWPPAPEIKIGQHPR